MKSSKDDLRKRGKIEQSDMNSLLSFANNELVELVNSNSQVSRSVAIRLLSQRGYIENDDFVTMLLKRLGFENCLYTRIEICNALEKGNSETATQMVKYLGDIGKNQYHSLPDKVSLKTSYPLPRDIVARSLGRMNPSILPVLLEILYSENPNKISEILDAIGFMVFYHQEMVTLQLLEHIIKTKTAYSTDNIILWKCVLCLSAFPLEESRNILNDILETNSNETIRNEVKRSLNLIHVKCQIKNELST